ncbi:polysialyltransferase family glycosyltransferase [Serratia fonticola]
MTKYIAYIESPLQAFNLIEYLDVNNITLSLLVINKRTENSALNYGQISYLLNMIKHCKSVTIDVEGKLNRIIDIRRELKSINSTVSRNENVVLIAGEYRARVFWMLANKFPKREVVLLDDGTATLRIKRGDNITARGFLKSVFLKLFGVINNEREKITFFSVYDIHENIAKKDRVIRHSYQNYRAKLLGLPKGENKIFIIGSPLYEAGVTKVDDIELTKKMIHNLRENNENINLIYIPHRREREEKINALKREVEVCRLDYPFEIHPLVTGENVVSIAGFYSSLYDNLIMIYDDKIKITAYVLNDGFISDEWVGFVASVYKNYESYKDADVTLIKEGLQY